MIYSKYKYIATVAELHSISKAAQKLYISQPALTRIIINVENELGMPLFNRSVLPIQLTFAGERYLEEAKRIISIDEALRNELLEISEMKRGILNIGTNYAASALWLPHILPAFHKEYPGIVINLIQKSSLLFESDLIKGDIDLAFTTESALSPNLNYEHLSSARILTFIPQNHPMLHGMNLSNNSIDNMLTISPDMLDGQNFVLLHPTDGLGCTISKLIESLNIHPAHVMFAPDIVSCYRIAASGMGITFATPYATRYTLPGFVPVIANVSTQEAYEHNTIAYSKKRELNSIENRFISITKNIISDSQMLQPLSNTQWTKLKTIEPDESYYFV